MGYKRDDYGFQNSNKFCLFNKNFLELHTFTEFINGKGWDDEPRLYTFSNDESLIAFSYSIWYSDLKMYKHYLRIIKLAGKTNLQESLNILEGNDKSYISTIEFSPDNKFIAVAGSDEVIKLYNILTGEMVKTYEGHTSPIKIFKFSPDGAKVISISEDKNVKIWNFITGEVISQYSINNIVNDNWWLPSIIISKDAKYIAYLAKDSICVIDSYTGNYKSTTKRSGELYLRELNPDTKNTTKDLSFGEFSPDNKYITIINHKYKKEYPSKECKIFIYKTSDLTNVITIGDKQNSTDNPIFSNDGKFLYYQHHYTYNDRSYSFTKDTVSLYSFDISALDIKPLNILKTSEIISFIQAKTPPTITIISPDISRGFKSIKEKKITVKGKVIAESKIKEVLINNINIALNADNTFSSELLLVSGENSIIVKATDIYNNTSDVKFVVNSNDNTSVATNFGVYKRIALVIGNGAYTTSPLRNPVNDANIMSTTLKNLGFEVSAITDATFQNMRKAISDFGKKLSSDKNTVGLFYYAGHGIQLKGKNYLVPVDAQIEGEADVTVYAVDLDGLLSNLEFAGNNMNIVILDACRNNPFARSFRSVASNGLATMNAPSGTMVAFATAPGSTAADGEGNNGLYTQELVKAMTTPNLKIEDIFKQVRVNVIEKSNKLQTPWENSSVTGDFYFVK